MNQPNYAFENLINTEGNMQYIFFQSKLTVQSWKGKQETPSAALKTKSIIFILAILISALSHGK